MKKILIIFFFLIIISAIIDHVSTILCIPLMSKEVITYRVYDENGIETQKGSYTGPIKETNKSITNLGDWALKDFINTALLIGILSLTDYLINSNFKKIDFVIPSIIAILVVWRLGISISNLLLFLTFR